VNFGQADGIYDIRDVITGLDRVKLASAFFYTSPGPRMMWMFQELGYDLNINTCTDGVTIEEGCRTANKPLPWGAGNLGYYEDVDRKKLYEVHGAIINLTRDYREVFKEGTYSMSQIGSTKRINITHATMDVTIIGNFALQKQFIDPNFSQAVTWYDFLSNDSIIVNDVNETIELWPGEFHIYTTLELPSQGDDLVSFPDPPVMSAIADQMVNQDEVLGPIDFTVDPGGNIFADITISGTSSNSNVVLNSDIVIGGTDANRTVTVTPRPGRSGNVVITLTASDGAYETEETFNLQVVPLITGLEDNSFTRKINIFPNPSSNVFHVSIGDGITEDLTFRVMDLIGRVYMKKEFKQGRQNSEITLDASGLLPGIYLLRVDEKDKNTGIFRLLVE
jgi:type IX secretion system substrate protein